MLSQQTTTPGVDIDCTNKFRYDKLIHEHCKFGIYTNTYQVLYESLNIFVFCCRKTNRAKDFVEQNEQNSEVENCHFSSSNHKPMAISKKSK